MRARVDIEDLAQETYLRLLRARDLRDIRNPQAYLLKVAVHVIAEWRHDQPAAELRTSLDEELLMDDSTPEFEVDAHISQDRLNEALAAASPVMRPCCCCACATSAHARRSRRRSD